MQINDRHRVLGTKMDAVPEGHKVAVFANGCFGGSEKGIWRFPGDGITCTAVGYCAGFTPNPTYEKALGRPITTEIAAASDYDQYGGLWYFAESYHQQYLASPGARPYCSAQPQGVSVPPFESWAPEALKDSYAPKLPEAFWKQHAPAKGCSVVNSPNEPIEMK